MDPQFETNQHRAILQSLAHKAMLDHGLLPDFSPEVLAELDHIQAPASADGAAVRDLKDRLWASIDNDDSLDLDQLTVAEELPYGKIKIFVAVADVDAIVAKGSAIDAHAACNTTSVYTGAAMYPMLPVKLSNGLTSLNQDAERLAVVIEMVVAADGTIDSPDVYRAKVCNHAKLAYRRTAAWLEGQDVVPPAVAAVSGLEQNLRLQDKAAQRMKQYRHVHGALSLETIQAHPVFDGDQIRDLEVDEKDRAKELIEDFMIAANGVTARYLGAKHFPSIRRVVRTPKRWDRIVAIAADHKFTLPELPDAKALEAFLVQAKAADPLRFPDLSLSVIKLIGAGEYIAEQPGGEAPGHFALAVKDYTHSTAPNRRYTDIITQRLLKSAVEGKPMPYAFTELETLATHCTEEEDTVNKVERQIEKSAAALLLEDHVGEQYDAMVTGASVKGTWVRLLTIPVEGKLVHGFSGLDVGDRLRVKLESVDVARGFIDFRNIGPSRS